MLKDKPFRHENINGVYVIASYTEKIEKPPVVEVKRYYMFSGTIKDVDNEEGLPYAYITTPEKTISTDETGYFSFKTEKKGNQRVQVQYLGYQAQDTILSPGVNEIRLQSAVFTMDEVIVSPVPATMLIQSGSSPGEIRINHQIAKHIPGSIDNSVFNLMRMMPGVRASGEPSEDLIVWGSNMGESKITYDGYTLFGIKNYNDHIGSVNPYMVKDIRIMKGGYGSNQGGRIGAITEITGIDGNFNAPSVKATVSNYTMNLFASVPITKKLNVSAAYRQTFYNLYNNESVDFSDSESNPQTYSDIYIKPDYHFQDANLKLSGKTFRDDSYYISLYGANDRFKYSVNQPNEYDINASEKNRQYGGAASYKRVWKNGSTTKVVATFSRLTSLLDNLTIVGDKKPTTEDVSHLDNEVQEFSVKLNHDFYIGSRNKVQVGGEWQQYRVSLNDLCGELEKPTLYINDNISLGKLSLNAGVRVDMPLNKKVYVQPRLSGTYKLSEELIATASWGLYNQFLTRTAYQYDESGFQTVWTMADSTFTKAMHTTAGIAYSKNGFLVSMEGYYKTTKNSQYFLDNTVYKIDNTILGADLFAKKQISNHTLYGSYSINSLSKPQRELSHEIKVGGIGAFDPFYFSLSYVYGTGFAYISTGGHGHGQGNEEGQHGSEHEHTDSSNEPYSRFDIGAAYRTQIKKVRLQAGVSLLNVFGTKNIKYNYQVSGQNTATNIFTKATPFTPTVFLEIIF
ncbi:TonB-dependent receptor [Petrimonas sulfuriphila]|uniref:TonB-dependent receptor n=1 Tax=Petrimonas TaxID=307628 RepID=UPI002B3F59BA|nr:carboxypeptidase-like regulatory domain-containing protein [Petrimonas sp.]MEA5081114.1 carboxypeptidase-like regulatory domain-containing protein [Dysgonamonadaceae bacterium]